MNCPHCNNIRFGAGARYCGQCGTLIDESTPAVSAYIDVKQEVSNLSGTMIGAHVERAESVRIDRGATVQIGNQQTLQSIREEFHNRTNRILSRITMKIPIIGYLARDEVDRIEEQFQQRRAVLLTGAAGTGKTGIVATLAQVALERDDTVLLIDARQVASITSDADLARILWVERRPDAAIRDLAAQQPFLLIIDQVDSIVGSPAASILVEFAAACSKYPHVKVVVVSRNVERDERDLLQRLANEAFVELVSFPLDHGRVQTALETLGVLQPSAELLVLAENLLNLEIIARLRESHVIDIATLLDEVDLWLAYIGMVRQREALYYSPSQIDEMVACAATLAKEGLRNEERTFEVRFPRTDAERRLLSWGILVVEDGRRARFRHEKFQDFLYAWNATEMSYMPHQVSQEILSHRTKTIIQLMSILYKRCTSSRYAQFLREAFDVG